MAYKPLGLFNARDTFKKEWQWSNLIHSYEIFNHSSQLAGIVEYADCISAEELVSLFLMASPAALGNME